MSELEGQHRDAMPAEALWWRVVRLAIQLVAGALIVAGAVVMAKGFTGDRPQSRRGPPAERTAQLVEVVPVWTRDEPVVIEASGRVVPARLVSLHARVQSEVIALHEHFVPGGLLSAGDVVVRLDDDDFELAERQARAQRDATLAEQRIELGNQAIARNEFELYGGDEGDLDAALMLRQPQLDSANAAVEGADAALELARLSLQRTRVRAPFDAIVRSRGVDIGSPVTPSTAIVELAGTETFWIEAAVPVDQLRWIDVPRRPGELGPEVVVSHEAAWGPGVTRVGRVVQLEPDLEEGGRLARLLVAVDDPMALDPEHGEWPSLFLDAWVELEIAGRTLDDVVALDRDLVRDGQYVWVMNDENRLEVRELEVAFRRRDEVLVSGGLASGERVITTALTAPVAGMLLRVHAPTEGTGEHPSADRRREEEAANERERVAQ